MSSEPEPDLPFAFGWDSSWCAVRCSEPEKLAADLCLVNWRRASWDEGLKLAEDTNALFVSPSIGGWTLIVGNSLPCAPSNEVLDLLADFSRVFGEAQYFATSRVTEHHAWARAVAGRLRRAYAFSGEQGSVLWDRGEETPEEKTLELTFDDKTILSHSPDDSSVFRISGLWSIDPTQIELIAAQPGLGILGYRLDN